MESAKAMRTHFSRLTGNERGSVSVIVGLSLAVLVAFAGIVLDLGHLYVTKTELQDAADACALSAARELTCDPAAGPCAASYLENAENAGIMVGAQNKTGLQGAAVSIAPGDVRFSKTFTPNSGYLPRASGADPSSKYVMCITRRNDIATWFMQVLGFGAQSVNAYAVATLSPAQTNCAMPIGLCILPPASSSDPFAGLQVGQWLTSKLSESATGSFDWVDFSPNGGGASELANIIKGSGMCSLPPPPTPVGEQGNMAALGMAWNTRFGLYKGGDNITTAPPDYTGYAYTPTSWPEKFNAYSGTSSTGAPSFLASRASHNPYQGAASGLDLSNSYTNSTASQLASYGADRRLVTVPVVDCGAWAASNPQTQPVLGYACVLMLHPLGNDNGPSATDDVWVEYRGRSNDPNSACATSGVAGGPGSVGPLVPNLVQ